MTKALARPARKRISEEQSEAFGEAHRGAKQRGAGEPGKHQRALAAGRPAAGGEQRADQIAEIVGRGDEPGIGGDRPSSSIMPGRISV